jgi:murein DD-endopeptidase MepM/ murein hydrolase activator NlpD
MQRLVLPYRFCEVLAGYKVAAYRAAWGFEHFGWDLFSYDAPDAAQRGKIFGSGRGVVFAVGADSAVGNCVAVKYDAAELVDGRSGGLVGRYFHLARINCHAGQAVDETTLLGIEGATGAKGTHLHIEFDTDLNWPLYSPQVKGGSLILNHGRAVDTTVDPAAVFWLREGDIIKPSRYGGIWNTERDMRLMALPGGEADKIRQLEEKLAQIRRIAG